MLQTLLRIFEQNREVYNDTIHQARRYQDYLKGKRTGTFSDEEATRYLDRIGLAVLALVDRISEEETATYELENAIF